MLQLCRPSKLPVPERLKARALRSRKVSDEDQTTPEKSSGPQIPKFVEGVGVGLGVAEGFGVGAGVAVGAGAGVAVGRGVAVGVGAGLPAVDGSEFIF